MHRNLLISALSVALATACSGGAGSSGDDPLPTDDGAGGSTDLAPPPEGTGGSIDDLLPPPVGTGGRNGGGTGGSAVTPGGTGGSAGNPGSGTGGQTTGAEPDGGPDIVYEMAVGAAYGRGGDGRAVLIDPTGTRSVLYNPSTGTFDTGDDIDELESGLPLTEVVAAAHLDAETYFFDASGNASVFDHAQAVFSTPRPIEEVLEGLPFASVGAAFGYNNTLFVFNAAGSSYAAYSPNGVWSPTYSFVTDFGGGGAPIASVGAGFVQEDNAIVLFNFSGERYSVYAGAGEFSSAFDSGELVNGTRDFNDFRDD
jgi:hypothetical protein